MNSKTREDRIGSWYQGARIGLFLHWGMRTGDYESDPFAAGARYRYEKVEEFERDAAAAGWSAGRWVDTAKRLRAKYITLATFHCDMGYLKVWPSAVPGSPCTKRDYLRELIDAAATEGIRIVIYVNRDPKNARQGGVEWLNKVAYGVYKNDESLDVTTRSGFLAYSLDVMRELLANYPELAGFWFDGYHDKREAQAVFAALHGLRDDLVLIDNDFSAGPVDDEDAMAIEDFGKVFEPEYDYASGAWVGPGDKEFAFKTVWDWFYLGEGRPDWGSYEMNYAKVPSAAELVRRIVAIAGTSWNAHLGFGPKIGGDFPAALERFVGYFDEFMTWAEESISGTYGGGYDREGFPPGYWNDGAYGVTTLAPGGETHYLHVLTAPAGDRLALPDAGYTVRSAVDLRTGAALAFAQADGLLEIRVPTWEATERAGDTVIKLETTPTSELRIVPRFGLTATAGSELPYHPAVNVVDGDYETMFRGAMARGWPQSLTVTLPERRVVSGLSLVQPETGAVREGGYGAPLGERIRGYEVHVSEDGLQWGAPVAAGELRNQRGKQVVRFAPTEARNVRLTALGNYGGTGTFQLINVDLVVPSSSSS